MSDPRQQRDVMRRLEQTQVIERARTNYGATRPTSPTTNLPFFDTTIGFWIYWDGTRWLTTHEYQVTFSFFDATTITYAATTAGTRIALFRSDYKPFFTVGYDVPGIGATNTGANFWTFNFVTNTGTTIWSFTTAADAPSTNPAKGNSTWSQPGAVITFVQLNLATTGAPSAIVPRFPTLYYRLVV